MTSALDFQWGVKMLSKPLADRFWEKVDVRSPSQCWEWTASRRPDGYGQISETQTRKILAAHRVSYELNRGAIPEDHEVRHTCNNPGCVNPTHLVLGTHTDNMVDMAKANRSGLSKLSFKQVAAIREMRERHNYSRSGITVWLANWFGISQGHVSAICNGTYRRHTNVIG